MKLFSDKPPVGHRQRVREPALREVVNPLVDRAHAINVAKLDRLVTTAFSPTLDPRQRIKISRGMVRQIVLRSVLLHPWPAAWRRLYPTG